MTPHLIEAHDDGEGVTVWWCEPPAADVWHLVTDGEWAGDVHHIRAWRPVSDGIRRDGREVAA